MGKQVKKQKKSLRISADESLSDRPFASLADLKARLPVVENAATGDAAASVGEASPPDGSVKPEARRDFAATVVLRRDCKGRHGKTATVVSGVLSAGRERKALIQALKQAMGVHASDEGETIVVGGEPTERLRQWFVERGAQKVVLSG